jgi:O-antigen/teichoic acid export membrane protein
MLARVLKAINALVFGHVIARFGSLLLVPLFLSRWTSAVYGEYLALFAVVSYLSSLDIGVQLAAVNRLTRAYARQDWDEYRVCQHSALALYVAIAAIGTVLLAVVAALLHVPMWIGLRHTGERTASLVILLLGSYVLWSLPFRIIAAVYQTTGNLARSQWINNAQQVLSVVLSATILLLGGGMVPMAVMQVTLLGIVATVVLADVRHRFPQLYPGLAAARFPVLKELLHPSILFAAILMANVIVFQGSILLVSAALGGVAVAVFSISRTAVNAIREALYTIQTSMWPDLARLEGQGELARLRIVHRLAVFASSALAVAAGGVVWFEGASIITVWTRGHLTPDVGLLHGFALYLVLQTGWVASSAVATATNRHKIYAVGYFVACVVAVGIIAAFVRRPGIGLAIIPVALIIGELIGCYHFVMRASCRLIHESYPRFAARYWGGLAVVSVAVTFGAWGAHAAVATSVLRWVLVGAVSIAISMALAWVLWLAPQDRNELLVRLRPWLQWRQGRASAVEASTSA